MKTILMYMLLQSWLLLAFGQLDSSSVKIVDTILRLQQPAGTIVYTHQLNPNAVRGIKKDLYKKYFFLRGENSMKPIKNFLSLQEKKYLMAALSKIKYGRWNDSLFQDSKRIAEDSMWNYISDRNKEFYEKYNTASHAKDSTFTNSVSKVQYSNVFQFSPPIYLRKKTVFLFFILRLCGSLCGIEELYFYKLQNGSYKKWILVSGGVF